MAEANFKPLLCVCELEKIFYVGKENNLGRFFEVIKSAFKSKSVPRNSVAALSKFSFSISPGEIVGILGKNGAGKSTLVGILNRTLTPSSGFIESRCSVVSLSNLGTAIDEEGTLLQNARFLAAIHQIENSEEVIKHVLEEAALLDMRDTSFTELPDGTFARIAVGIAQAIHPHVLLIDEVFSLASRNNKDSVEDQIRSSALSGSAAIVVSHDVDLMRRLCSRIVWIEGGKIRQNGPTEDVLTQYAATFLIKTNFIQGIQVEKFTALETHEGLSDRFILIRGTINSPEDIMVKSYVTIRDGNQKILFAQPLQDKLYISAGVGEMIGRLKAPEASCNHHSADISMTFFDHDGRRVGSAVRSAAVTKQRLRPIVTRRWSGVKLLRH